MGNENLTLNERCLSAHQLIIFSENEPEIALDVNSLVEFSG